MYSNNATASGEALGVTGLIEEHPPANKPSSRKMVGLIFMVNFSGGYKSRMARDDAVV
jgi:hypothetical protein